MESSFLADPKISRFEEYFEASKPSEQPRLISKYRGYFNIDSSTVGARLLKSLIPTKSSSFFGESVPDLYGPLWCSTTLFMLVFFIASTEGISIMHTLLSGFVIYTMLIIVPLAGYFTIRQLSLGYMVSLYGYSLAGYSFTVIISGFFQMYWRVAVICAGGTWRSLIFILNFSREVNVNGRIIAQMYVIIVVSDIILIALLNYLLFVN